MPERERWPRDDYVRAVWEDTELRTPERITALAYAAHAGGGDVVWIEPARLQQRTGLGRTAALAAVRGLVAAGWLVLVEPARQHYAPRYRITVPPPARPLWTESVDDAQGVARRHPESVARRHAGQGRVSRDGARVSRDDTDYSKDYSKSATRAPAGARTREDPAVITDPSDSRPGSFGFVADQVRAAAAAVDANEVEVRAALDIVADALRDAGEDEPDRLAAPVLVEMVRDKRISRLAPYVQKAVRDLARWVERARTTGHRPPRDRAAAVEDTRPEWCGRCDKRTRQIEVDDDGRPARCPRCHPLSVREPA